MNFASTSDTNIILEVNNLTIDYQVPLYKTHGFRDSFIGALTSPLDYFGNNRELIHVLSDINLKLNRGERLGILGNNGTGKTSLCRFICGLYGDKQNIKVNGNVRGVFDTQVAVFPELSGRENLEVLIHFFFPELSKERRSAIFNEALHFVELGKYLDAPLKTYSKGMITRLFLSAATSLPADLLVLDEVYSGADYFFNEKMSSRLNYLLKESGAVILVSHSQELIQEVCTRTIVFNNHRIEFDGPPSDGINFYRKHCNKTLIHGNQIFPQ